jgi:hypothetical protein
LRLVALVELLCQIKRCELTGWAASRNRKLTVESRPS